jgi:hypothetical protein
MDGFRITQEPRWCQDSAIRQSFWKNFGLTTIDSEAKSIVSLRRLQRCLMLSGLA